ncbi:MAG: hypothetical protein KY476_17010 [Planctomycetes bacterium]|nr:hypothetical protein [Planctomycetota bacterium]
MVDVANLKSGSEAMPVGQFDLVEALRKRPFRLLRIVVSDGTEYEVSHPEFVMVGPSAAMVFFPPDGMEPPVYERYETVALSHIVRLLPSDAATP